MITSHDDVESKVTALTIGYDDFLTKGCTEVEVVAKIVAAQIASLQWMVNDTTVQVGATWGLAHSSLLPHATLEQMLEAADPAGGTSVVPMPAGAAEPGASVALPRRLEE
jgi:hypothetical protein